MLATEKKKLTIRADARLIEQAKTYAEAHNTSVSQLIEAYLLDLSQEIENEHSSLTRELTGIIPESINAKEVYHDYLMEKYGDPKTNSG